MVTPFVGVWIETQTQPTRGESSSVTPFVGVWIETDGHRFFDAQHMSHPSWGCGLKQPES